MNARPSSDPRYDIAILGGGLAGLSLAVRLAEPKFADLRVLLVEPRTQYRRDRTWSYWTMGAHPFDAAVASRWNCWGVATETRQVLRSARDIRYESIPADNLYKLALERLNTAPHIDVRLGVAADAIEDEDSVRVRLPDQTVKAGLAFDTRPPAALGRHGLTQIFLGQEIETDQPVFDPGTAMLMDFRCTQPGATHFTYVLPSSSRCALIEDTWFAPAGMQPPDHRVAIRDYMMTRYGVSRYSVTFEESGALPMDPVFQPAAHRRLLPLGSAGGASRPSTGYAFNAIQAQCDAIVADLSAGRMPTSPASRPAIVRMMDQVLLTLLEHAPEKAPEVFSALFAKCMPRSLIRFMNDAAQLGDFAALGFAMPFMPSMAAIGTLLAGRLEWQSPVVAG